MGWHAKLGGQITIIQDGVELAPPENKTIAVLLIGLISRGSNWCSRDELGRLLYPDSDPSTRRATLRQSLFRLRRWLGASAIEDVKDRVRLGAGLWSHDLLLESGQPISGPQIAPGLIHPWIESIRLEWAPPTVSPTHESAASFAVAVETVARKDPDTARGMLVGGALLTESLSVDQFGALIGLTQPKDRRDPLALEHIDLRRSLYQRLGCFKEAKAVQMRAFRMASQQRRPTQIINAGAVMLFLEIEDGHLDEAASWVAHLQKSRNADTRSLLVCNAQAAYLWNMNRLDEAVAQMSRATQRIPSEDRLTRLHFWSNFSVLCAEAGMFELGQDALAEARALAIEGLDIQQIMSLDLAKSTRLMSMKQIDESISLLEGVRSKTQACSYELGYWYATEALSEALALKGSTREACMMWKSVEARRLSQCSFMTPRVRARRDRILQYS